MCNSHSSTPCFQFGTAISHVLVPSMAVSAAAPALHTTYMLRVSRGAVGTPGPCTKALVQPDHAWGTCIPNPDLQVSIAGPVQLWWPAGYGSQPLYSITATFRPDGCSACTSAATGPPHGASATWAAAGEPTPPRSASARRSLSPYGCSSVSRAIGFRTVELVTAPLAEAFADIGPDGRGWKEQLREDGSVPSQLNESEAWQQLGQRIADARQDDTPNETLVGERGCWESAQGVWTYCEREPW